LSSKTCYNLAHGTSPAPSDLSCRPWPSEGDWHDALCPTDGGADETGLYRTDMAGELLAGRARATRGEGEAPVRRGRTRARHHPPPPPTPVRNEKGKSDAPQPSWCPPSREPPEARPTARQFGARPPHLCHPPCGGRRPRPAYRGETLPTLWGSIPALSWPRRIHHH